MFHITLIGIKDHIECFVINDGRAANRSAANRVPTLWGAMSVGTTCERRADEKKNTCQADVLQCPQHSAHAPQRTAPHVCIGRASSITIIQNALVYNLEVLDT